MKEYTADEVINIIKKGWNNDQELKNLYDFITHVNMSDEEEEKFIESDYAHIVYESMYDLDD